MIKSTRRHRKLWFNSDSQECIKWVDLNFDCSRPREFLKPSMSDNDGVSFGVFTHGPMKGRAFKVEASGRVDGEPLAEISKGSGFVVREGPLNEEDYDWQPVDYN